MNELYEFMKQVDVIVLFCLIYGLAINGIVWTVSQTILACPVRAIDYIE